MRPESPGWVGSKERAGRRANRREERLPSGSPGSDSQEPKRSRTPLTAHLLIPNPWRALAAVLVAGAMGSAGGILSGDSADPLFPPPAVANSLRGNPRDALLTLEDVLFISPEFETRPAEDAPEGSFRGEGGPDFTAWGRVEAHRIAFWRANASMDVEAPIEIQCEVSRYREASEAQRAFAYWRDRMASQGTLTPSVLPADQVAALTIDAPPFTHQWVQFRKANGVGFLLVTGFSGYTPPQRATELARTMADRMR